MGQPLPCVPEYAHRAEVLAPAGSLDICKAVINAGADAVYLGGNMFGARAYADNLNEEEVVEAVTYAHRFGRKVYLTVNTLLKQNEIEGKLKDYLLPYYECGLDAVIVQDFGVLRLIKENFPDLNIHASTQMTQTGSAGAALLQKCGVKRIVTAREMTLAEIRTLHEQCSGIEIESFVHGALCYCYSGQCLLSSYNGGRSGNRGRCAQPCRLAYDISMSACSHQVNEKYVLSLKDLCALDILPDILEAGVYSLKIEGRMKNVIYAAYVTSLYRKYVDLYLSRGRRGYQTDEQDIQNLKDIYNRGGFTSGYYNNEKGQEMISIARPNHCGTQALEVLSNRDGKVVFKALEDIYPQDVFEIDAVNSFESGHFVAQGGHLKVNLPKKYPLYVGKVLCRMRNARLNRLVKENYIDRKLCLETQLYFTAHKGENMTLTLVCGSYSVTLTGESVSEALKHPVKEEEIREQLVKTGGTYYQVKHVCIMMDLDIFIPIGQIKQLRRRAFEQLDKQITGESIRKYHIAASREHSVMKENMPAVQAGRGGGKPEISVYLKNLFLLDAVLKPEISVVYLDFDLLYRGGDTLTQAAAAVRNAGKALFFALPHILAEERKEQFVQMIEMSKQYHPSGYLVRNLEELQTLGQSCGFRGRIRTDSGLYIFNRYAKDELREMAGCAGTAIERMTLPYELDRDSLREVAGMDTELIVYGRAPLMVSKQCVRKTLEKCNAQKDSCILSSPKGKKYEVESVCSYCYTVMKSGKEDVTKDFQIATIPVGSIRYEFDDESEKEVESILKAHKSDGLRSYFYRGVE